MTHDENSTQRLLLAGLLPFAVTLAGLYAFYRAQRPSTLSARAAGSMSRRLSPQMKQRVHQELVKRSGSLFKQVHGFQLEPEDIRDLAGSSTEDVLSFIEEVRKDIP